MKTFLIDLDGTLLIKPELKPAEEAIKILKKVVAQGHQIGICTGRSESEIKYIIEKYDIAIKHYISFNGMLTSTYSINSVKLLQELAVFLWEENIGFEIQDNITRTFSSVKGASIVKVPLGTKQIILTEKAKIAEIEAYKIVVRHFDNTQELQMIAHKIRGRFPNKLELTIIENRAIEIVEKDITKEYAMKMMFARGTKIIAIGDSENDLGMLISSTKGYLIANGNTKLEAAIKQHPHIEIVQTTAQAICKELIEERREEI
ncbi:MAG: HAD-IIB family hydrolase [Culicoidibacterales bacterium]